MANFPPKSNAIKRRVKQFSITAANHREQVELSRGYDLHSLMIHIYGTIQLTTGATSVNALAPAQLLSRVDIQADGNKNFHQTNGLLAMHTNFERKLSRIDTAPSSAAIATHSVDAYFYLDRVNADGPRPKDSALHTQRPFMSLLQANMQFGGLLDLWTGGSPVLGTVALTCDVYQIEEQEFSEADAGEPRFVRRCSFQDVTVDANNSAQRVQLPVGSLMRGVKLVALDDTGEPTNTMVNSVILRNKANVRLEIPWNALRADNVRDYGLPNGVLPDGVAFVDAAPGGELTKLFNLEDASEADITLDVTKPAGGDGTIFAEIVEYVPTGGA